MSMIGGSALKRILLVLVVSAILSALMAAPAFADKGGIKPANYGDCASAAATGEFLPFPSGNTMQEFTALTSPNNTGKGNADQHGVVCGNFPPPPG
jgi:hypothetical protein